MLIQKCSLRGKRAQLTSISPLRHLPTHTASKAQLETKLGSDKAWKAGGDQFGDSRLICEGDLQQLRRETEFTL